MYRFLGCTAAEYMSVDVKTVTTDVNLSDLEGLFRTYDFNAFPVVEHGKMVGIVTKTDVLRAFAFSTGHMLPQYDELMRRTVFDVMTDTVVDVEPETPLTRILELMVTVKIRSFPVVGSGGRLLGMISREDVMRALRETTMPTDHASSESAAGKPLH